MPALAALATSVGLLAVLATWLFGLDPLTTANLQVWQAFIAWGCHFMAGGKIEGSTKTVVCMSFGALVGMVSVMIIAPLGALGSLAAPVAVGLGATVIVLASSIPFLATIPASVYGFAAIAGLILLGPGTASSLSPTAAIIPTILSVIIGAIFGYVSEFLAGALTKK
jgi:hypothetical protein